MEISKVLVSDKSTYVSFIGVVYNSFKKKNEGHVATKVKDFSGEIFVKIPCKTFESLNLRKGVHLKISGKIGSSKKGDVIIDQVDDIVPFGLVSSPLEQLPESMRESASQLLLSRICSIICDLLKKEGFFEFETKVVSSNWYNQGLEPLRVIFPGFGMPANLITSPSAQLLGFLKNSLLLRVFTKSLSFTTTYRYPNGASESRIIMAKATDISEARLVELLTLITDSVINSDEIGLNKNEFNLASQPIISADWDERFYEKELTQELNIVKFNMNIKVEHDGFSTNIIKLIHVVDNSPLIIAEGSIEEISEDSVSTITFYPDRFLDFLNTPYIRNLRSLSQRSKTIR